MWFVMFLFFSCTPSEVASTDTDPPADTAQVTDTDDALTIDTGTADGLTGTIPSEAREAPNFTATNYDGSERTKADLMGKATVMWFYPLAKTPG